MKESQSLQLDSIDKLLIKESDSSFQLRRATDGDINSLIPLINSAYMYENEGEKAFKQKDALRANAENIREAMKEGVVIVAVAHQSQQIIGCFQYKEILDTNAYFGMLAVDPSRQRQGIGKKLVQVAEGIGKMRERNVMEIQVVNHSTHLLELYARLGYQEFGRRDWAASVLIKPSQFVLLSKRL